MNTHNESDKTCTRKLAMMSGAMLLVAAGIFGGFFYLQRQAGTADSAPLPATREEAMQAMAANSGMIYDSKNHSMRYPDLTEDEQEAFMTKLKMIREKWRPWAQRNQSPLKKLLSAQPNDEATLMSVYQALPSSAEERGIPDQDLAPIKSVKDFGAMLTARLPLFSWEVRRKGVIVPEKLRAQYEKSQQYAIKVLKEDFAQMRDIRLSIGRARSDPRFSLWASGRITKSKRVHQVRAEVRNGRNVKLSSSPYGPDEEIVPPFEFLQ